MKPTPLDAERYLLSMMFSNTEDVAAAIHEGLSPQHFSDGRTRAIYTAAIQSFSDTDTLEPHEFATTHGKTGALERDMGGMKFFLEITGEIISSSSVSFWVNEIKDAYLRRQLEKAADMTKEHVKNMELTPQSIAAALSNKALDLINEQEKPMTLSAAAEAAEALLDNIIAGTIGEHDLGLPTPIDSINRFLGMPRPGELITIAARPGGGKSSMLRALTRHIAENVGRTLFFSREMPMDELVYVFAQEASRVSWRLIRKNEAPKDHVERFRQGIRRIKGLGRNLTINDRDRTLDQLIARIAASARSEDPLRCVAVDYLQRYDPQQQRGETRDVAIGRFTMALKDAAMQHKVPVFLGAQIGRGSERENRQPRLSDLRESGNIEQDSDRVWLMWIPDMTPDGAPQDPNDQTLPIVYVELIQAKGRGDGQGKIKLAFHRQHTTFTEWRDVKLA